MSVMVEETEFSNRGVITRLLGFVIMLLGVLDSLLTLRAGIPAYEFLLLFFAGAVVFSIGVVRGRQKPGKFQ